MKLITAILLSRERKKVSSETTEAAGKLQKVLENNPDLEFGVKFPFSYNIMQSRKTF